MVKRKLFFFIVFMLTIVVPFSLIGIRAAYAETLPYQTIIIDDGSIKINDVVTPDAGNENNGFSAPNWTTSTGVKGYDLSSTKYTSTAGRTITWNPRLEAGTAKISFYKLDWADKADSNVKIEIVHNGTTDVVFLDLRPSSGAPAGWVDLGEYYFSGVGEEYVQLTRSTGTSNTILTRADAVKFEGNIEQKEPHKTIIIDDGSLTIDHVVTVDAGNANNGFSAPYWTTSAGVKGYNNSSSKYTDAVGRTITWNPRLEAGTARISFYKLDWADKADSNVKIEIVHNGITDVKFMDLRPTSGPSVGWVDLGEYEFSGDDSEFVRLTRTQPTTGTIITRADAVKFEGNIQQKAPPLPPLRSRTLANLSYTEKGSIENDNYKATFYEATWDGGKSIVRDMFYKNTDTGNWTPINNESERLEEQWVLLDGNAGSRTNYYDTMNKRWITFDGITFPDSQTAVLTDSSHGSDYDLQVNWSMAGDKPDVSFAFTPRRDGNYVIGYQSFTTETVSGINEVLNGFRSHAKMVGTVESTSLRELSAPMSLVEKNDGSGNPLTYGVFVPSGELPVEFEPTGGVTKQRLGMSLVNNEGSVQPILYAPQLGTYSQMTAESTYQFHMGLIAQKSNLYESYTDILRNEYEYSAYRENVSNKSLTDAMFNMIDLLKIEPQGDDSVNYVPSPSGWWSRAKGFIDIENEDSVRTSSNAVLLGAYYLTGDDQLYDTRALPSVQYGVSRNGIGWSPTQKKVYGVPSLWKMATLPFDVSSVAAVNQMMGTSAGIGALAEEEYLMRDPDQKDRGPVIQPLMMYRMTGDAQYLQDAKDAADNYITQHIDTPASVDVSKNEFIYYYSKLWMEILELYEETQDPKYLDAAYKEAKRYATMFVARPVPEGNVTIPQPETYNYAESFHWPESGKFQYPRLKLPEDIAGGVQAERWLVSPSGLTFEAGSTTGYYRMNAQEAPFMLRLSLYTGDKLLQDIAHNAVIGRYSSYPGYYYKGFAVSQLEPDFPLEGPSGATSIYYHHIPGQLGQTMDYLISEQSLKSNGSITFPSVFETNFLWFKYHLYGNKPGQFYGNSDVWLWMPKGIIKTNHPQLNWITGESGDKFYIGLSNASSEEIQTPIELNEQIIGFNPAQDYTVTIIRDNGTPEQTVMSGGIIQATVSGKGITAIIVEGLDIDVPLHQVRTAEPSDASYFFDTHSPIDAVKGMLIVKPDETVYDAYVQAKTTKPATIHYSLDGGATYTTVADTIYPMEWSIRVNDLSQTFTYYVESEGKQTRKRTLYLPDQVTETPVQPDDGQDHSSIIVDNTEAETEGVWIRDTTANDYYYDNYVYAKSTTGTATSKMRWRPDLPESVTYSVYYKIPQITATSENWATNASFTVYHSEGSDTVTVDETMANGTWVHLGDYPFAAGDSGYVELTNKANKSRVVADAMMWVDPNRIPQLESAVVQSDRNELQMTQTAQLSVTGYLDNGLIGDLTQADVQYFVDRTDLAEVNSSGLLTLLNLDGDTDHLEVWATVTIDGVTLTTPYLTITIKDLTIIVDSTDTTGLYTTEGSWSQSNLAGYKIGVKSRYSTVQGSSATWKGQFPEGKYTVSIYKLVHTTANDNHVKVEVKHKTGTEVTYIDATVGSSGWVNLGTFDFAGDGSEYVRLTRVTPTTVDPPTLPADMIYTRVDAVMFERHSDDSQLLANEAPDEPTLSEQE